MSFLEVKDIYGGYGDEEILSGVSLCVGAGEIVALVGPNGAGKSTILKAIVGLVKVRRGRGMYDGIEITSLYPDQVARKQVCYVPQEKNVFLSLTVHENLEMGAYLLNDDFSLEMDRVYEIFPPLKEKRSQVARTLSGGQRQMLAIGRALMLQPRLLLLDEPTAGLSPVFVNLIFEKIQEIHSRGVGILIVEQNAKRALALAHRGYVLAMGRNRHEDTGDNLLANREVAKMFLGG